MKKSFHGEYSLRGYTIFCNGSPVYEAGNNRLESQTWSEPGGPNSLPLKTLRAYCIQTGKEIAAQAEGQWDGATRAEETEFRQRKA